MAIEPSVGRKTDKVVEHIYYSTGLCLEELIYTVLEFNDDCKQSPKVSLLSRQRPFFKVIEVQPES